MGSPSCRRTSRSTSSARSCRGSSRGTRSTTPRSRCRPTSTVGEALALLPKRAHGIVVVVEDGVPVGVVTDGACQDVDRFTQLSQVMAPRPADHPGGHRPAEDLRRPHRGAGQRGAGGRGRPPGRRHHPQGRAALGALPARGQRGRAPAHLGRGRASTATSRARPRALLAHGVDVLVVDTAHGHQEKAIEALRRASGRSAGSSAGRRRQRGHRRGHARPDRGGRRRRQGRRRPGRHVHHPDDDRRRAAAVLRRRGVRRRRPRAGQARLGRRRRAPPARRRAGAGRRRGERDGRLLVRRHLRERRRHPRRRPGRLYKESFGMASARAVKARTATASGFERARAGAVRGGHQRPRGCTSTRRGRASRT